MCKTSCFLYLLSLAGYSVVSYLNFFSQVRLKPCFHNYFLFTADVPFSSRYVASRSARCVITASGYLR